MTTNLERWRFYMQNITSPDVFIDMGFYYMISSALQRRVYVGGDEHPIFANQYIILVADPGIGKGLVIKPVTEFLRYHKMKRLRVAQQVPPPKSQDMPLEMMQALIAEYEQTNNIEVPDGVKPEEKKQDKIAKDEPLVLPMTADAMTYEALVRNNARAIRSIVPRTCTDSRLLKSGVYTHSSICFCLEEISSLFRQHTHDLVNYLIKTYDCGNYRYETKTQGIEQVKNTCVNLFGGTQPSFMRSSFDSSLLNEGFASRCLFVYADKNRFERFRMGSITDEQRQAKDEILEHIRRLTELFGLVTYAPDAEAYMADYVEKKLPLERIDMPAKLQHYAARKRAHLEKLCLAVHFADNVDFTIQLPSCILAFELLHKLESKMEFALEIAGRNPLGGVNGRVLKFIAKQKSPVNISVIWQEFVDVVNERELGEVLSFLQQTGKIGMVNGYYMAIGS